MPGWGRSPTEGNDNTLQRFLPGESIDRGAWWSIIHGVSESHTAWKLSTHPCNTYLNLCFIFHSSL